jgi:hypothetical protein
MKYVGIQLRLTVAYLSTPFIDAPKHNIIKLANYTKALQNKY